MRDDDSNRYNGNGVLRAVNNVNEVIAKNIVACNSLLVKTITKIKAQKDDNILIPLDVILDITNKYLGIYTFFINDALPKIDVIDPDVDSL